MKNQEKSQRQRSVMFKETDYNRQRQTRGKGEMDENDREKEYGNSVNDRERQGKRLRGTLVLLRDGEANRAHYNECRSRHYKCQTASPAARTDKQQRLSVPAATQAHSADTTTLT